MGKGDHCLGACYRVSNIYVISTVRDKNICMVHPPLRLEPVPGVQIVGSGAK